VYVRLTSTPKEFALEIWGAGSNTPSAIAASLPATEAESNFGAAGMRERMRQLGGSLEISAGNSGTLIRAVSPLGQNANAVVASFSR
jgi:signal transduction histidine kinase